jgi:hypothetical protein
MADWDVVTATPAVNANPWAVVQHSPASTAPLAARVEQQESRGNPNAINKKSGAVGSMQTLPSTLEDPGYGVTPAKNKTPEEMKRVGVDYLNALRKKYGNDTHALAAYNWGPGNVDKLLAKTGTDSNKFIAGLPAETKNYIKNINADVSTPAVSAKPAPAPAAQPAAQSWAVVDAKPLPAPAPAAPTPPQNGKEWLASISEPSIKAGANLVSGAIAPFLSDKSKKILQDKGLYTPGESPLKEYSTAAYGTIMSPVSAALGSLSSDKKQTYGVPQNISNLTGAGKEKTDNLKNLADTAMDVAGFAIPGVFKKGEPITPASIEANLVELEKKHDATTNPAKQAKIKQQMMQVVAQHPEAENLQRSAKPNEAMKLNQSVTGKKATNLNKGWSKVSDTPQSLPGQATAGVRNMLNPASAGVKAENTIGTIRAETGTANRNIAKGEAKLAQSYETAASMTPEQQADYYQYMEGRSKGATLADPGLQKIADDTRDVFQGVRKEIETLPEGDKIGFYQDYFPHNFKNPEQARAFANNFVAKQGSSGNLKARKYPTLADAQAAGLQLADTNPVRAASRYVNSMNNYIASKKIATQIIDKGDAKYYTPGRQPEGWVPLTGRFAERTRSFMKEENPGEPRAIAQHEKLYAPPEVARVYNNFYSRGLENTDLAKPYELGRTINAINTSTELALSAYHLGTITGQLLASDVSRVIKNAAVGDWTGVAKAAKSATVGHIPFIKGSTYKLGSKFIKQYKGLEDHGLDMESITEHFERGGGKLGQSKLYRPTEEGGLITGKGGIKQAARDIGSMWNEPGATPKAKAALSVFQRATEDVSYPLFEKYIPSVKTGAFANLMGDWLRQNPGASDAEISAARKKYVDLVDDRFGEMNMDNVFWHKYLKQAASLFLRAQGWDIGLVRQAGGGVLDTVKIIRDAFKGKKPDPKLLDRPAFLASVIGTMALTSAAYQYLKTGKAPDQMLDYFAPKTGGTSVRGTPERTILPTAAHGRELLHIAAPVMSEGALGTESPLSGLEQEVTNKMASFPKNVMEAFENQDYAGNKLGDTTGPSGWVGSIPARVGHVAEGFAPFGLTQQGDKLQGSNLSGVERRLLGMRPASMEISDPDNFKAMRWTQEMKKEMKVKRAEARKEGEKEK